MHAGHLASKQCYLCSGKLLSIANYSNFLCFLVNLLHNFASILKLILQSEQVMLKRHGILRICKNLTKI